MKHLFLQDWDVIRAALLRIDSRAGNVMLLDAFTFAASLAAIWFFGMSNPTSLQQQIASGEADVLAILVRGIKLLVTAFLIVSVIQVAIWRVIRQKPLSKDVPDYLFGSFAGFLWILLLLLLANLLPGSPFEWGSSRSGLQILIAPLRQFVLVFFPLYYLSILFSDREKTKKTFGPFLTFFHVGILSAWKYPLFFAVSILLFTAIILISSIASAISLMLSLGGAFTGLLVFAVWVRWYVDERLRWRDAR